jgi:hypothetical protein
MPDATVLDVMMSDTTITFIDDTGVSRKGSVFGRS